MKKLGCALTGSMSVRFRVSVAMLACLLGSPSVASAATFTLYDGTLGSFGIVTAGALGSAPFTPTFCEGSACGSVTVRDLVNQVQNVNTDNTGRPVYQYDTFPSFDLYSPGFYSNASGSLLSVFDLPEYQKGSLLYLYDGTVGSFGIVTAGVLSSAPFTPKLCAGSACGSVQVYDLFNQVQTMNRNTGRPVYENDLFPSFDLSSPGFYRNASGSLLAVYALPDAFAAPAPVSAVPDLPTWMMLVAGFGLMGIAMRRRRATVSVAGEAAAGCIRTSGT